MRIGSVAFLVVLGGTAATMPQRLSQLTALAAAAASASPAAEPSAGDLVAQRHARPGAPEVSFGAMIEADAARRLQAQGVEGAAELARQARGNPKVIRNPLIDVLLGKKGPTLPAGGSFAARAPSLPSGLPWRPGKDAALWATSAATWGPVMLLGLAVVLAIIDLKGAARALAGLCHWVTGHWLILLSFAAPGLRYLWRVDVWGSLPSELCWAPAAAVLVSAAILRTLDLNEPIWNKTVLALAAPVVSGVAVPLLF